MKALRFNGSALVPWAVVGWLVVEQRIRAQIQPPPIAGTTAVSMVLEGTMKKVYAGAHTVIVSTIDGVEHVVHFTTDLAVCHVQGQRRRCAPGIARGQHRRGALHDARQRNLGAGNRASGRRRPATKAMCRGSTGGDKEITIRFITARRRCCA